MDAIGSVSDLINIVLDPFPNSPAMTIFWWASLICIVVGLFFAVRLLIDIFQIVLFRLRRGKWPRDFEKEFKRNE